MKRLPVFAFILIGLLGALLVYVCEDIPVWGDPNAPPIKYTKLFSMAANGLEEKLSRGVVPRELINRFEERGFPRPYKVVPDPSGKNGWNVFIIKDEFHYAKEEKYYFIRKDGKELTVFRYAFVVRWIEKGFEETAVPNMVTYGLADYRGYDTLGETTVIFTGGASVILLLRRRRRRKL